MKYLNGKVVMKGDVALASTPDGTVVAGSIHQIIDRTDQFFMSGYPLRIYAHDALLASDCFAAVAGPLLQAEKEAKEKAIREAAEAAAKAQTPSDGTQTPPAQQNAS